MWYNVIMYEYITHQSNANGFLSKFLECNELSLDIETTSLDPYSSTLLLLQLEMNEEIFLFDVRKTGIDFITYILDIIKSTEKLCIGHNIKFDIEHLFTHTGILLENVYDTMIAEVLINQGIGKQFYSYTELVDKYCMIEINKDVRKTFENYEGTLTNEQLTYSALDVKFLKQIRKDQTAKLKEQGQSKVEKLEMGLVPVVASMELNGVLIDVDYWRGLAELSDKRANKLEIDLKDDVIGTLDLSEYENAFLLARAFAIPITTKKLTTELEGITDLECVTDFVRDNFNLNSPKQVKYMLKLMGVPVDSTGEKVILPFKRKFKVVELLLDYREWDKRRTTYGENILDEINPKTGRLHVDHNQVGTVTGRFAVSRLHQIPRENKYRRGFISKDGYKILTVDYSQQEYRIAGAVSKEEKIIEAYLSGSDMHTMTASILYEIPLDEVTKEQRDTGKTINFAVLYGTTSYGLAYNLGISLKEAEKMLLLFHTGYPRLSLFKKKAEKYIWENKVSSTPFGRKRYWKEKTLFRDYKERDNYRRRVCREGFNLIIQGLAGDITKIAMLMMFKSNPWGDKLRFYTQVHDEVVMEVHDSIADEAVKYVKNCMVSAEQIFLGEIPAEVDKKLLDYWTK